jgi:hypothetical protein
MVWAAFYTPPTKKLLAFAKPCKKRLTPCLAILPLCPLCLCARLFFFISHKAHPVALQLSTQGIRAIYKPSAKPLCPLCLCAKLFLFISYKAHPVALHTRNTRNQQAKHKTFVPTVAKEAICALPVRVT